MLRPLLAITFAAALVTVAAPATAAGADFVPDEVIVKYEDGTSRSVRADVQEESGTSYDGELPGGSRQLEILDDQSVRETIAELREDPRVAYAVPNVVARASAFFPNDPGFGGPGQWPLTQWNFFGPASVNAPDAWELAIAAGAPGGAGAVVAVLDTGVAYANRGRFRRAPDLGSVVRGYDFVSNDRYPYDENGHGTHVSGTIAEQVNNGNAVTGLAYGAKIMPLRVLDRNGEGKGSAIARAIRFAADRGAHVVNMSFEFGPFVTASLIPDIVSAVRYAHRKGVVVVGAAGNQADRLVAYPARTNRVIAVGATTERSCQAEYSNSGIGLDVVAPGGGLDAPNADNPSDVQNCRPGEPGRDIYQQTYTRGFRIFGMPDGFEGTSMAAPHVSAAAALIIATRRLGPRPSPDAVELRLEQTARDLGPPGPDYRYGAGLINPAAALGP